MKADFSGYATKADLTCSDGRIILPNAFKHQDKVKVPLVWQHGHSDPENVIGHAILENRDDGVYTYAFFNKTQKAQHLKEAVEHGDITQMSIWANQLVEKSKRVIHGAIREVSLVLSGANPGALIDNINIQHGEGLEVLVDEAIIYTGLPLEHSDSNDYDPDEDDMNDNDVTDNNNDEFEADADAQAAYDSLSPEQKVFVHSLLDEALNLSHAELGDDATIEDVYNSMNEQQKAVLHYMVGEALDGKEMAQSDLEHADELGDDATIEDVYNSMNEQQKAVLHYMLGEAVASAGAELKQDDMNSNEEGNQMSRNNVFENGGSQEDNTTVLSHSQLAEISAAARKGGSLKAAITEYGMQHGIDDIENLFPEAQAIDNVPEFLARRSDWVRSIMGGVRRSPFSRIKTLHADLTLDQARAKGYVTGAMKKEEFFAASKRVTNPTTVYKKQKLDRDDVIDITDFDVINWMKSEMRIMLDEEIARAILIGDGREVGDDDKIDEASIRPVATDSELYTTKVYVNLGDASSSYTEVIDALIRNRRHYRGSGVPTMYISDIHLSEMLLLKDSTGRDLYPTLDVLATKLRVKEIISVEVMDQEPDLVAVIFNPMDYVVGATNGGQVNMFDDFDIDYNALKYLMEGRMSGALTRLRSAIAVWKTASNSVLVVPTPPEFDGEEVTITNTTGVVYRNALTNAVINAAGSPYAVAPGATYVVSAEPATGYHFASSEEDTWSFTND